MGLKYNSFAIRGVDVSQFNGVIDWTKVSANFVGVRSTYGITQDSTFTANWPGAKKFNRMPYHYLDYYSNHHAGWAPNGMSDADWGKSQAEACWNAYKKDSDCGIVFLDIEEGNPTYAPRFGEPGIQARVMAIAKSFLVTMDSLNKKNNGIYASVGRLSWFDFWFRNRPLWGAWYNEYVDSKDVIESCRNNGWLVDPIIWQFTSEEEIPGVGQSDANGFIGTAQGYKLTFGNAVVPVEPPVIIPTNTRTIEVKTTLYTMNVRSQPKIGTNYLKTIPVGKKIDCLEKIIEVNNIWQRVGIDQYVAEFNNGIQYLK
jgi:GH25 family lysozyme M1 (1,4-beta-N-acetylmuramidase)